MSTKIYPTVNALGKPTSFDLTPGQSHDLQSADVLLKDKSRASVILNKAYDAQA